MIRMDSIKLKDISMISDEGLKDRRVRIELDIERIIRISWSKRQPEIDFTFLMTKLCISMFRT
jgi:hypothetical protein